MSLSHKQVTLANYLLNRLGFLDEEWRNQFLYSFQAPSLNFKHVTSVKRIYAEHLDTTWYKYDSQNDIYYKEYPNLIDILFWEIGIRKYKKFPFRTPIRLGISAVDLAAYTYCKASFSIAKTFNVPTNDLGEFGSDKHDENRLIDKAKEGGVYSDGEFVSFVNDKNKFVFDDINSAKIIYYGHHADEKVKYFENQQENFYSQPDYIFQNSLGIFFVVEEKHIIKYKGNNRGNIFYNNHKIQLLSYIYYLNHYRIEYGYLVYWIYDNNIIECNVLQINRNDATEQWLFDCMSNVKEFMKMGEVNFDNSRLNINKCANCVNVILCGHKTKTQNKLTFPYNTEFLNLTNATYPESLKNNNTI